MKSILYPVLALTLASCGATAPEGRPVDRQPGITPDYAGVVIPPNIAPLSFAIDDGADESYAVFASGPVSISVKARRGSVRPSAAAWKKLLAEARGDSISVIITSRPGGGEWVRYAPFALHVASEPVDPYIAYRLIEPVYSLWNNMGIYQRNVANYDQTAIIENRMSGKNCMNCHSFCMQDPSKMLFHMRETYPGTIMVDGQEIEKLNTGTSETISPLVYPSWHPSGRYVAFSVNQTLQSFHHNDRNRIEVFDGASDVVVYDVERRQIVTTSRLFSPDAFETFPTFSPDGQTLYFCSATARDMPHSFKDVKYSLCSIAFDAVERTFGDAVDTLYNAAADGRSASFPRVSPDGHFLLYTLSGYGNFSIWHADADLYMIDLSDGVIRPLRAANSPEVESYHSWSSNSRWIVFSSRRGDGLYTRPYIAYINGDGEASKPFLLPQKDAGFYHRFMKSYNIPEFITGPVEASARRLALAARDSEGTDLTFIMK